MGCVRADALRLRRGLVGCVAALALLLPGVGHAAAPCGESGERVIGPGREAHVQGLLRPHALGAEVAPGVVLRGIAIRPDAVVLQLHRRTAGGAAPVPGGEAPTGAGALAEAVACVRPTGAAFELVPPSDPAFAAASRSLAEALRANDDGSFFATPSPRTRRAPPPAGPPPPAAIRLIAPVTVAWWALGLLLALALAQDGLVGALVRGRREQGALGRRPEPDGTLRPARWLRAANLREPALRDFATLGVGLFALAVRLSLPFTVLHANGHGFGDLTTLLARGEGALIERVTIEGYGPAWFVGERMLLALTGVHHEGVALASALLGAAAAALSARAGMRAGLPVPVAAVAAALVFATPVAARVGHSESPLVVAQVLVAAALLLGTSRPWVALPGGAVTAALLATGHPVGPAIAAGAGLLAAGLLAQQGRLRPAVALLGLMAVASALAVAVMAPTYLASAAARAGSFAPHRLLTPWAVLWSSPDAVPAPLAVLIAVGLALLVARAGSRTRSALLAAGAAVLVAAALLVRACVTDGLRYQAVLAPLGALALGHALVLLLPGRLPAWPGRRPALLRGALAALAVVGSVQLAAGPPLATAMDSQGQLYRSLRAVLAELRGDLRVLTPEERRVPAPDGQDVQLLLPTGSLGPQGPRLVHLPLPVWLERCERGDAPPALVVVPPSWWLHEDEPRITDRMRRLVTRPLVDRAVTVGPERRLPPEFFQALEVRPSRVLIGWASCPPHEREPDQK